MNLVQKFLYYYLYPKLERLCYLNVSVVGKGRAFLLLYVVVLVMNYPVKNFNKNVLVMSESATCGQEMAFNQTRELVEAAFSPMAGKSSSQSHTGCA